LNADRRLNRFNTMQITAELGSNSNLTCLKLNELKLNDDDATRFWYAKNTGDDCHNVQIAGCIRMENGTMDQRVNLGAYGGIKHLETTTTMGITCGLKTRISVNRLMT